MVRAIAPSAIHLSQAVISVEGVIDGWGVIWTSCADAVVASGIARRPTMNAAVNRVFGLRGRTGPDSSNGMLAASLNGTQPGARSGRLCTWE